jgi:hypothetical protein
VMERSSIVAARIGTTNGITPADGRQEAPRMRGFV